ncbi:hypothetical protein JB92DRAFT_2833123 [Gautieria morchelliformis]|nr:hypothetical protein JB92DRAFT_2833123 [Gautieria morchelliformis]
MVHSFVLLAIATSAFALPVPPAPSVSLPPSFPAPPPFPLILPLLAPSLPLLLGPIVSIAPPAPPRMQSRGNDVDGSASEFVAILLGAVGPVDEAYFPSMVRTSDICLNLKQVLSIQGRSGFLIDNH